MSHIFDFAIQMEKDGETMYQDFARQCRDENLRDFFLILADEEKKHAQLLEVRESYREEEARLETVTEAENVFKTKLSQGLQEPLLDLHQAVTLAKAAEVESIKIYEALLKETTIRAEQRLLNFIIEQEKQHIRMIAVLRDHIMDRA